MKGDCLDDFLIGGLDLELKGWIYIKIQMELL